MIKDQLLRGSFRGVEFNFTENRMKDGRKTVIHSFLNSDVVKSEDMGRAIRSFELNIFTSGIGQDYFSNRSALETALNTKGSGVLVHPTYGKYDVVINGTYTGSESINRAGVEYYTVTFVIVEETELLQPNESNVNNINNTANQIATTERDEFKTDYKNSFLTSINNANVFTVSLGSIFRTGIDLISDSEKSGEFADKILEFEEDAYRDVDLLADELYELFTIANEDIDTESDKFDFFVQFFNFGDDYPSDIEQSNLANVELQNNLNIQKNTVQTMSLSFASVACTLIDYLTDVQLDDNSSKVQEQFQKVFDDCLTSQERYNELQGLRNNFTTIIKDLVLDVSRIIEIDANMQSLATLIYLYYGTTESSSDFEDRYELIKNLNELENTEYIQGTLKVVTESSVA